MLDLSTLPDDLRRARGDYSTVRAAHEDAMKRLQMLCGQMASVPSKVLRKMQPEQDELPDSVESLINEGRSTLDLIEACTQEIESLAKQKAELKPIAWPK